MQKPQFRQKYCHVIIELLLNMFVSNKQNTNVDIKFNTHDTFLEHKV